MPLNRALSLTTFTASAASGVYLNGVERPRSTLAAWFFSSGFLAISVGGSSTGAVTGVWRRGSAVTIGGVAALRAVFERDLDWGASGRLSRTPSGNLRKHLTVTLPNGQIDTLVRPYEWDRFKGRGISGPFAVDSSEVLAGGAGASVRVYGEQREVFWYVEAVAGETESSPSVDVQRGTCVWVVRPDARIDFASLLTDDEGVVWEVMGRRVLHRGRTWGLDCRLRAES